MTTTQSVTGGAVAKFAPKPSRLPNGEVLCLKLGTVGDLGRYTPPLIAFVSKFRQGDPTCIACGGRCTKRQ